MSELTPSRGRGQARAEISPALPVDGVMPTLKAALSRGTSAVLQAPPGAGKTTRVPLALLDEPWLQGRKIVMLEPRRLAARSAARYMALSLEQGVGATVGYRVRRDARVSDRTRIEVVTEGILTRMIQSDPTLEGIGLLIFDEFHERSVHADLGLALALNSRVLVRPELRILVMSATLDGARVAAVLDDAPIITSEGRAHPVEVRHRPRPDSRSLDRAVVATISDSLGTDDGDLLVFLPGAGEIRRVGRMLQQRGLPRDVRVTPLYGDLSQDAQDAAIAPSPPGSRKVILSTPIAETSLTIDGVRVVIDSGLARAARFSQRSGMTRLETVRVSRASAVQRCGRAGRLAAGVCYRLWPENEQHHLLEHSAPEILQTDLTSLALELAVAGTGDPDTLRWLDPPPRAAFEQAMLLLRALGSVDSGGRATEHGRALAALPVHPRIAHMLITASRLGHGALACDLAALLGERDFVRGLNSPADADIRIRLDVLNSVRAHERGALEVHGAEVDASLARRVAEESNMLRRQLHVEAGSDRSDDAGVVLALAYPDRIAQRRGEPAAGRFLLRNGRGAMLTHPQALSSADYVVAADLDASTGDGRIYLGAALSADDVESSFAEQVTTEVITEWDERTRSVRAKRLERLGAIVLRDFPLRHPSAELTTPILLAVVRREGLGALPWGDSARTLRQRMAFMRTRLRTRSGEWPDVSDAALLSSLAEWILPDLTSAASLATGSIDVGSRLRDMLDWQQRAELERRAPTHYRAPTGTSVAVDYSDPAAPSISVRLQEMFGVRETPTVDDGQMPLTVKLLSPARRPVQVTRDLAGFWRGSYFEVRKELRGRYPKHVWPDDPLAAPPTARAKRRGE